MRKSAKKATPEDLVKAVGRDYMVILRGVGRAAVKEIATEVRRRSIPSTDWPYIFWALTAQKGLPDLGPRQRVFAVAMDIMVRTGAVPSARFQVADDPLVDEAIDGLAEHMGVWAARNLLPEVLVGLAQCMLRYAPKVPEATDGEVPEKNGLTYLKRIFPQIVLMRTSWFEDAALITRVLNILPDW